MEEQMLLVNMHLYPKAYVCMYVCLIINWLSIGLCQLTKTDQLSSIEQLIFLITISSTVHDLIILLFVYIKPSHHQGLEPLYLSYFTLSSINWMKWNFKKILYVHVLWQTTCLVDLICSALLKALKTQDVSLIKINWWQLIIVEPDICKTYAHTIDLLCWTMFQLCYVHYYLCSNYVTYHIT